MCPLFYMENADRIESLRIFFFYILSENIWFSLQEKLIIRFKRKYVSVLVKEKNA